MPQPFLSPGVFTEEIPAGVAGIQPAPTAITAFIGRSWRGPLETPVTVRDPQQFLDLFGAPWDDAPLGHAVRQYFANGGAEAVIVRVATCQPDAATTPASFTHGDRRCFMAASPGSWGMNLRLRIQAHAGTSSDSHRFDLEVFDDPALQRDQLGRGGSGVRERFHDLSTDPTDPRWVAAILEQQSRLLRACTPLDENLPLQAEWRADGSEPGDAPSGNDGNAIGFHELAGDEHDQAGTGVYALRRTGSFNLLCIPPFTARTEDNGIETWQAASRLCRQQRALLLVDAPANWTAENAVAGVAGFAALDRQHAALYFPRLLAADPTQAGTTCSFAPCGAVAGIIARTDRERGVWHAPAGVAAILDGGERPASDLSMAQQDRLNPRGINIIRRLHDSRSVVWGSRTLIGDDREASEWKHLPVKRTGLWIEQSLLQGMRWAESEISNETLWAKLRLQASNFLHEMFLQGAFQGSKPEHGYFVRCDAQTMTVADTQQGIIKLLIGFAPLKPAEFIVLPLQLNAHAPG